MQLQFLNVQECLEIYPNISSYLPDRMRNNVVYWASSVHAFALGGSGVVWLSDIQVGHRANIHVVLWNLDAPHHPEYAKQVLGELIGLYRLQRLEALVPVTFPRAGGYALKCGFEKEGTLRRAELYDGKPTDMDVYAIISERQDLWPKED